MTFGDGQVAAALATLAVVFLAVAFVFRGLRRRVANGVPIRLRTVTHSRRHRARASVEPSLADEAHDVPALVRSAARASRTVSSATHTRTPLTDIAARLEPASRLIGAHGMVVWVLGGDGASLEVLAGHGYSEAYLDRLGPLSLQARALTALACVGRQVRRRTRNGTRLAGVAVPMEHGGELVGALTAEIDPSAGDVVTPDAEALVALLASQMTPLVATLVPATAQFRSEAALPDVALSAPPAPIAPARTRPHPPAPDRTRPHPPAPDRTRPHPPAPDSTPSHPSAPARTRPHPPAPDDGSITDFPAEVRRPIPFEPIRVRVRVETPAVPPADVGPRAQAATAVSVADEDEAAIRDARSRFIAGFRKRCTTIDELITEVEAQGPEGPIVALRQIVHRLSGLAVIVGLPAVGARATELDHLIDSPYAAARNIQEVRRAFVAMQEAFAADLAQESPTWAAAAGAAIGAQVMLVTSDAAQAARMVEDLQAAGYRVTLIAQGLKALAHARQDRPSVVLLDLDLSGELDGHDVCRRLKADPALADIPVVLVASHASTADRMAGFALGADDYLTKPVQPVEMLLRVRWMLTRPTADRGPAPRAGGGLMAADPFVAAAREVLRQGSAALGLVRVPPASLADLAAIFSDDLRRKDLLGRYSETQLAVLMPGATAGVAARRIGGVLDVARAAGLAQVCAGITATGTTADRYIEPMLAEAESALASAHVEGAPLVVYGAGATPERGSVLVVDDDPDVVQVIDARLKAAGLQTLVAFDGQQALHQVETAAPRVMVLELMLPKRSGFDVLARLRDLPEPRPRVVIVSSRSREEDVMRAFELGADDYLTKPFNPQELLARVTRLLK